MAHPVEGQQRVGGRFLFAYRCLLSVAVASIIMGISMTFAPESQLMRLYTDVVAAVFWHQEPVPLAARAHESWLVQLLGTTIAGWGVLLTFVVAGPFRRREVWAWWAILSSVLAWVALDVFVSGMAGVVVEVAFATAALILVAVPLGLTWSSFRGADD